MVILVSAVSAWQHECSEYRTVAQSQGPNYGYPQTITYSAAVSGTYYIEVYDDYPYYYNYGDYTLTWTCKSPTICSFITHSKAIRAGRSLAIAGVLNMAYGSTPISGQKVRLQDRTGKHWRNLSTTTTNAKGLFSLKVKPKTTTRYRAEFGGTYSYISSLQRIIAVKIKK